uniref:Uncharacterized protein n=1 Tax=Gracilaria salicornia TaxID=172968 RepID=W8DW07_9FLOR|nr:hypothetical protein [Gracilaria salicornia]AHH24636.1 hypothetical protein [Gracilaria salicornia]
MTLLPEQILNLHQLESSISFLKKEKVIKDCTYNVIVTHKGLIIYIKYSLYSNQVNYTYNQENINIFKNNALVLSGHMNYAIKGFRFKYLRSWLKKFVLFKSKQLYMLDFKHHWNFTDNLHIKLNSSTTSTKTNIKLSFLQRIKDYINIYFLYTYYIIYYYKFTYTYNYIQILNSNFFLEEISNLRMITKNFKVELQYDFKNSPNIIQKVVIQSEEQHFISIYTYSYQNIETNIHHFLYSIPKLKNLPALYLLFLVKQTKFRYSNTTNYLALYLHFLFYNNIKISKWVNYIINLHPYITLNYIKIFNLPSVLPYIYNHTIQLEATINIFDMTKNLMVPDSYWYRHENTNKKIIYNSKLLNTANYLFNIKYKIYPIKYISIYLLINHINNISYNILYLPDIHLSELIYCNHNRVGIGVNLYTPFKEKPFVFIEYFINDRYKNMIYIGTSFS